MSRREMTASEPAKGRKSIMKVVVVITKPGYDSVQVEINGSKEVVEEIVKLLEKKFIVE